MAIPGSAREIRVVKASEFKARCLGLMDEVATGDLEIVITKNGRPVSRLVPCQDRPDSVFGIDRSRLRIVGDIVEPLGEDWEADADTEAEA